MSYHHSVSLVFPKSLQSKDKDRKAKYNLCSFSVNSDNFALFLIPKTNDVEQSQNSHCFSDSSKKENEKIPRPQISILVLFFSSFFLNPEMWTYNHPHNDQTATESFIAADKDYTRTLK